MSGFKVNKIDYHRNGISGLGFYVAIGEAGGKKMLVIRMGRKEDDKTVGNVLCAAFDLGLLADGEIEFGRNSFRGDHYVDDMDAAITKHDAEAEKRFDARLKAIDRAVASRKPPVLKGLAQEIKRMKKAKKGGAK